MNLLEEFKKNPGFVYRIGTDYYYIGKMDLQAMHRRSRYRLPCHV
ncbi:MAG: hypothetical protein ACLR2O_12795 [Coprococcus sp.]